MMKRIATENLELCLVLAAIFITIFVWPLWYYLPMSVDAQSLGVAWSEPVLLSDPEVDAWTPTIATDRDGGVHVVWSQTMMPGSGIGGGDTLFYARWDGESWTLPVDVLVSPTGGAQYPDLVSTSDGMLHLVWGTGGTGSQLLYSRAPACCANNPRSWSEPVSLYTSILDTPAIIADELGRLHIAYASNDTGNILYQHSEDGGDTWADPVSLIAGMGASDEYAAWPRIAVDGRGRVHLVWSVLPWPGRAVMYARSDDGGFTWNEPQTIDSATWGKYESEDYGPIYIDVEAVGDSEVHLIWDGAPTVERHHIWSSDGGQTWSAPDFLFPQITGVGRGGWNDMALDSAGILHAVCLGNLHAAWSGTHWSLAERRPGPTSELDRLAISGGNTLHVVWNLKAERPHSVWYVQGQSSSAPTLPTQTLPRFVDVSESAPTLTASDMPSLLTETPEVPSYPRVDSQTTQREPLSLYDVILGSTLPALLLVAVVCFVALSRRRWKEKSTKI